MKEVVAVRQLISQVGAPPVSFVPFAGVKTRCQNYSVGACARKETGENSRKRS
jgi:hypothetical protein